jgi:hypothetical protein
MPAQQEMNAKVQIPTDEELYLPWSEKSSYFNRMLHGGEKFNIWAEIVLRDYLPKLIFNELKDGLAVFCGSYAGGSHVPKSVVEGREIIIISEGQIPPTGKPPEKEFMIKEFIRVILHEVAHAYLEHKSHAFDGLSDEQSRQQETEADELVDQWINQR